MCIIFTFFGFYTVKTEDIFTNAIIDKNFMKAGSGHQALTVAEK